MNRRIMLAVILALMGTFLLFPLAQASGTLDDAGVTFDAQGGLWEDGTGTYHYEGGRETEMLLPEEPIREGYVFGGWYALPDGQGNRLQSPAIMPQEETTCFAWWVPEEQTEVYTVTLTYCDASAPDLKNQDYPYTFIEKNTGAAYVLHVSGLVDKNAAAEIYEYSATIRLPKYTPLGDLAEYQVDQPLDSDRTEINGVFYCASFSETDRRGAESGQDSYFDRRLLFRRMINPDITIVFEGACAQDVEISLSVDPISQGQETYVATAKVPIEADATQTFNLYEAFWESRTELQGFVLDETDYRLEYLGRSRYTLAGEPIDGFEISVQGDAQGGWVITYRMK